MLPYLRRHVRQPLVGARVGSGRTRGARRRARAAGPCHRRATPARSCSRAAGPRRSTSRSRARLGPVGRAAPGSSPRAVEHHAVGHTLHHLEKFGFEVVELPVDRYGRVDPADVERAMTDRTILVAVMLANNEVARSSRWPTSPASSAARRGVLFHVDAVQAAPVAATSTSRRLGADLVALAAHKAEGPKGTGALWIRQGTHILAQQHGGSQERHRRAGTENVAGAVGMARAFELVAGGARGHGRRASGALRDRLAAAVARRRGRGARRGTRSSGCRTSCRSSPAASTAASVVAGARPRGHRRLDRLRLHDRLDRGQPRPDGDGLPGRRGPRRAPLRLGRTTTDAEIDEAARDRPRACCAGCSAAAPGRSAAAHEAAAG